MEDREFKELMKKDFSLILEDLENFMEAIPRLAKIIGVVDFHIARLLSALPLDFL